MKNKTALSKISTPAGFTRFFSGRPIHVFLLPLFFILNIYNFFGGLLKDSETIRAWVIVTLGMIILFFLFRSFFNNRINASIAATLSGGLFLFFGNIKESLARHSWTLPFSHYSVLIPILSIILLIIIYKLWRHGPVLKLNLFLNILFILYTLIEIGRLIRLGSTRMDTGELAITTKAVKTSTLPNIYYLVLDCYPSSSYQKEVLGVATNPFDSSLTSKGFFVVRDSKSNYNYTAFSLASLFHMNYLDWLRNIRVAKPYHYNRATHLVEQSPFIELLSQSGFHIHNLSVLDLPGQPSVKKEQFLTTTGTDIIFFYSLWSCLRRDVIPHFIPSLGENLAKRQEINNKKVLGSFKPYNKWVMDSLIKFASRGKTQGSHFIYAHLEMPHFPYFFDSSGKEYPEELIFGNEMITNKERFTNYIGYTNKRITGLLDSVFKSTGGRDIFIIQSDHGLNDIPGSRKEDAFRNYAAFYFPDNDYKNLYHGMSNVNTFRILLNKYFGQGLPLLRDSTIYIK